MQNQKEYKKVYFTGQQFPTSFTVIVAAYYVCSSINQSINPHVHCTIPRPDSRNSLLQSQRGDKDGETVFI
jgi:hypothetical protein